MIAWCKRCECGEEVFPCRQTMTYLRTVTSLVVLCKHCFDHLNEYATHVTCIKLTPEEILVWEVIAR